MTVRISDILLTEKGRKIYEAKKGEFVNKYPAKFVAINVDTGEFYIGDTAEEAMAKAKSSHPEHLPYVTQIGDK